MSEALSEQETPTIRMPGYELAEHKGPMPPVADVPLEDIVPVMPALFAHDQWQGYFARLRKEDPVHFNEITSAGRFWSLTRYQDIKAVDTDWENFSSAHGITLGMPIGSELPEGMLNVSMFIAQDPPVHDVQRPAIWPKWNR